MQNRQTRADKKDCQLLLMQPLAEEGKFLESTLYKNGKGVLSMPHGN